MRINILLLFIIFNIPLIAQNNTLGINMSSGISFLTGTKWKDSIEERNLTKPVNTLYLPYTIGIFYDRELNDYFRLDIQINYSVYGNGYTYSINKIDVKGEIKKKLVEFPVLLNISTKEPKGLFFSIGPSIQCLLNEYYWKEESGDITMNYSINRECCWFLDINIGTGVIIETRKDAFKLELKYVRDLICFPYTNSVPNEMNALLLMFSYGRRF